MPLGKRKYGAYGSKYQSRTNRRRKIGGVRFKSRARAPFRAKFAKRVMSVVNRRAELKSVFKTWTGVETTIQHNRVLALAPNALTTALGVRGESGDNMDGTGSWTASSGGNRVGKKIFVKGIKVSLMIEQSQKRAYCNYWLGLIRNKVSSTDSLNDKGKVFEGLNSTIPMDYIDTDKVDIKFMKKISIRMPNQATAKDMVAGSGLANLAEQDGISKAVITNPQRIQKFYVPMNRTITYGDKGDGNDQFPIPKDHYQWVLWAYDNHSTSAGTDIGKIHLATKLNFTDV